MAASTSDYFAKVGTPGNATTLAVPGHTIGGTTFNVDSTAGFPNDTGFFMAIDTVSTVNGTEVRDVGSYTVWEAIVTSPTSVTGVLRYGTDQDYAASSSTRVYILPNSARENRFVDGMLVEHKQDGTHDDVTATSVSTDTISEKTSNTGVTIDSLLIKDGAPIFDGWMPGNETWTYASTTTFTIAGVNRTARFPVGTKIKLTQTTTKYFYVTAVSFSTNTTVTVASPNGSTVANASITSPFYSYAETPQGYPTSSGYIEIGRVSGTSLSLTSLPAKKYLRVVISAIATGGSIGTGVRFNNDTGSNYASRNSSNGGADSTSTGTFIFLSGNSNNVNFVTADIINISTQEKLVTSTALENNNTGAANAPDRRISTGKWADTTDQITRIDIVNINGGTGTFASASEVIVYGKD